MGHHPAKQLPVPMEFPGLALRLCSSPPHLELLLEQWGQWPGLRAVFSLALLRMGLSWDLGIRSHVLEVLHPWESVAPVVGFSFEFDGTQTPRLGPQHWVSGGNPAACEVGWSLPEARA